MNRELLIEYMTAGTLAELKIAETKIAEEAKLYEEKKLFWM